MSTRVKVSRLVVASVIGISGAVLLAASPHYKKGGQPVCTASGATVTCSTGQVAGLGNFDVEVSISFTATQGQTCHNPGNGNAVPGQNPATGTGGAGLSIPAGDIKNGTLTVPSISGTATITASSSEGAGCPGASWTVTLDGPITVTGGTYTFESPPGTVIPQLSFSF